MIRKLVNLSLFAVVLTLTAMFVNGCAVVDKSRIPKDDADRVPWNKRADWETKEPILPQ